RPSASRPSSSASPCRPAAKLSDVPASPQPLSRTGAVCFPGTSNDSNDSNDRAPTRHTGKPARHAGAPRRLGKAPYYLLVDACVRVDVSDVFRRQRKNQVVTVGAGRTSQGGGNFGHHVAVGTRDVLRPARIDVALLLNVSHAPYCCKPGPEK